MYRGSRCWDFGRAKNHSLTPIFAGCLRMRKTKFWISWNYWIPRLKARKFSVLNVKWRWECGKIVKVTRIFLDTQKRSACILLFCILCSARKFPQFLSHSLLFGDDRTLPLSTFDAILFATGFHVWWRKGVLPRQETMRQGKDFRSRWKRLCKFRSRFELGVYDC